MNLMDDWNIYYTSFSLWLSDSLLHAYFSCSPLKLSSFSPDVAHSISFITAWRFVGNQTSSIASVIEFACTNVGLSTQTFVLSWSQAYTSTVIRFELISHWLLTFALSYKLNCYQISQIGQSLLFLWWWVTYCNAQRREIEVQKLCKASKICMKRMWVLLHSTHNIHKGIILQHKF